MGTSLTVTLDKPLRVTKLQFTHPQDAEEITHLIRRSEDGMSLRVVKPSSRAWHMKRT